MSSWMSFDDGLNAQTTIDFPVHTSDRPAPEPSVESQEAIAPPANHRDASENNSPINDSPINDSSTIDEPLLSPETISLAFRDVRIVLQEQREQSHLLTTKLNILFVANGALLTSLTISRLMMIPSPFTVAEVIGFFISFTLLVRAFLPRQVAVSPNLEDRKFLERYLALSAVEYQLQMMVNWSETYNANKQRVDDVSKTLQLAAYATLSVATIMLIHILAAYVF
ncbi:MAG TPA: hypothetical protein V6D20_11905 [Candidatus Obscuribacterales bacterium]